MAPTFPNRFYQHAGQTDRIATRSTISTLPTIWDRLADAGLEGRYYFSDVAVPGALGHASTSTDQPRRPAVLRRLRRRQAAARLVRRPALRRRGRRHARSDDHPHADIRNGQAFMNADLPAVTQGPNWERTVLVFNYDEWGGFFDHVPPPAGRRSRRPSRLAGTSTACAGSACRACWCRRARGASTSRTSVYEHTSVLRMIEWRWSLKPLTVRDRRAHDLGQELSGPRRLKAPQFQVPKGPFGGACPVPEPATPPPAARAAAHSGSERGEWLDLLEVAAAHGWPV